MKKGYVCRNEDKTVNSCILKGRLYQKKKIKERMKWGKVEWNKETEENEKGKTIGRWDIKRKENSD